MSLFGSKPPTTTSAFTFGSSAGTTATTAAKPLFGTTTTSAPSLFGNPATSTTGTGLFGGTSASTGGGLFGGTETTASTSLFSTPATSTGGGLFGKTSTGFGTSSGGLFGKPGTGGLFGQPAAQQNAAAQKLTRQRETLKTIMETADVVVRSLTCPELYGDERDQIIGKLNQVAAALGVGSGLYKDGQSVPYTQEGAFHRFKAIGYNATAVFNEADGVVSLLVKSPHSEFMTGTQKQKVKDTIFAVLGSNVNQTVKLKSIKALPDNMTEINVFVVNKTSGAPEKSSDLARVLSEPAKKQQLEAQLKVDNISACVAMDQYQRERLARNPPIGFDDTNWQQACRDNPDPAKLVPHPIRGFAELLHRQKAQNAEVDFQNKLIDQHVRRLGQLSANSETASVRMSQQKITQKQLSYRLLRILCVQLLQQRFGHGIDSNEEQIRGYLEILQARLTAPQQIKPRIAEMLDVLRDPESELNQKSTASVENSALSEADVEQLGTYLMRSQEGLESLSTIIRENMTNLSKMAAALDV